MLHWCADTTMKLALSLHRALFLWRSAEERINYFWFYIGKFNFRFLSIWKQPKNIDHLVLLWCYNDVI